MLSKKAVKKFQSSTEPLCLEADHPRKHAPIPQAPSPDRSDDDDSDLEIDDDNLELLIHSDSLKANYKREGEVMDVNGEAEDEEISVWEGFQQEDLADAMLDMFEEEDEKDLDWLPPKLEARRNKTQNNSKKGRYLPIEYQFTALITQPAPNRPKTYKKGPDVMSKSKCTQQRYQRTFRGQGKLTGFGFKAPSYLPRVETPKSKPKVTI